METTTACCGYIGFKLSWLGSMLKIARLKFYSPYTYTVVVFVFFSLSLYNPNILYSSFHCLFHYPYTTPIYYSSFYCLEAQSWLMPCLPQFFSGSKIQRIGGDEWQNCCLRRLTCWASKPYTQHPKP